MRKPLFCILFACAGVFAQNTPDADAERTKALVDALKDKIGNLSFVNPPGPRPLRLPNLPVSKPGVCAIPLLRVIPPGTADKMTVRQPPHHAHENAGTVKVPAPACDEHLFTNAPAVTPVPPKP